MGRIAVDAHKANGEPDTRHSVKKHYPTVSARCGLRGFGQEGLDIEVPEYLVDGFCTNDRKISS